MVAQCHFVISGPNVKSDEKRKELIQQLLIDLKGNEQLYEDNTNSSLTTVTSSLTMKLGNKKVLSGSIQVIFSNSVGRITHNGNFSTGNSYQLMAVVEGLILLRSTVVNGNVAELEVRNLGSGWHFDTIQ